MKRFSLLLAAATSLLLACTAPRRQRLMVEPAPDELLQMVEGIERRADRPDEGRPLVLRQLVAVLAVELLPDEPGRSLGVHEQAVEVEQEPLDCHAVSLPDRFTPRTGSVATWQEGPACREK